jgi:hypothetical protein
VIPKINNNGSISIDNANSHSVIAPDSRNTDPWQETSKEAYEAKIRILAIAITPAVIGLVIWIGIRIWPRHLQFLTHSLSSVRFESGRWVVPFPAEAVTSAMCLKGVTIMDRKEPLFPS